MGSSFRNSHNRHSYSRLIQLFTCVFILSLLLSGCGEEDPIVQATGEAPIVENFGVAYLKRPAAALNISASQATNFPPELDVANNIGLTPGDVYLLDLTTGESTERNITSSITAPILGVKSAGDVSDLEVSYDGSVLLFSMHEGMYEGLDDDEQPTWNIWTYDLTSETLQQVIVDGVATSEQGNDLDPHFLPDGRIVFTSDRRNNIVNGALYGDNNLKTINERNNVNSEAYAHVLHTINPTADDPIASIRQISYNQSNDLNPTVLDNGKILFSRWDGIGPRNQLDLYTVNPDGTELDPYYGPHSHAFNGNNLHYTDAKQMADGSLVGMLSTLNNARGTSQLIAIDHENFTGYTQKRFTSPSLSTVGHVLAADTPLLTDAVASLNGSFITPHPIYEAGQMDRLLVAWDPCRLFEPGTTLVTRCTSSNVIDDNAELADALYSIQIIELDTELRGWVARPEEGIAIVNPVALVNRPVDQRPTVLGDKAPGAELNQDLYDRGVGIINIKSVYDTQGNVVMVDRPLEPRTSTNLLTTERAMIPMRDIEMDSVTGNVVTDPGDPNVVPVTRTVADIPTIRDPALTPADQRVARFVRISKAVPKVDTRGGLTDEDFGRSGGYEMRNILGYTEVEPDGSVFVEVPANIAFTIDILDAKGRSFMSHTNWMQVMPGETKVCGGCHSPNDGQAPVNIGAEADGPFANTVNTMSAQQGETMAETRARLDIFAGSTYQQLKRDLIYTDVWTDPTLPGLTPGTDLSSRYDDPPLVPAVPANENPVVDPGNCDATNWSWQTNQCRIAINFPEHIQPILDANCIVCHNDDDPNVIPPGNLVLEADLGASPRLQALRDSRNAPNRSDSYEFLFTLRPQMEPDGVGGRRFIVNRDPTTGEPLDNNGNITNELDVNNFDYLDAFPRRPALMSQGVARARRSHLIEVLTGDALHPQLDATLYPNDNPIIATPTVDHTTLLTERELRIIIEWADMGTQYYNELSAADP